MLANAAGKTLRNAYEEAPATFQKWTVKGEASTFLEQSRVQLSNAPDMDPIAESEEYKFGSFDDSAEKFTLGKYGKAHSLSWEALVNDDLGGFSRTMRAFVLASKRNLNNAVYDKMISNPALSDGVTLFHAGHDNYVSTGAVPSIDTLSVGRAMMRKQTGPQADAPLNITPAFIIVPVSLERTADRLITTVMGYDGTGGAGQANPFHNRLEVIADPVLDMDSEKAWYLSADPRYFDTIEVAYLDGQDAPYLEEEWGFTTDSWRFKLRHVWGICVLDHRGLFKNDGE